MTGTTHIREAEIREPMTNTGIDGSFVDAVVLGQAYPTAEAPPIARVAAPTGCC